MEEATCENGAVVQYIGEKDYFILEETTWREGDNTDYGSASRICITSHRVLFYPKDRSKRIKFVRLTAVRNVESKSSWIHSPKVVIAVTSGSQNIVISIRTRDPGPLSEALNRCLKECSWEPNGYILRASDIGIGKVMGRQAARVQQQQYAIREATADLNALKANAETMASVARRLSRAMAKDNIKLEDRDKNDLSKLMLDYGLADSIDMGSVARSSDTSLFFQRLSQDIDNFAKSLLRRDEGNSEKDDAARCFGSGMILLHDLYCLFNRARGLDPVSPEELVAAVRILESKPDACFHLVKLNRGRVLALQSVDYADEAITRKVGELLKEPEAGKVGITATEVALVLRTTFSLASVQLLDLEEKGLLCRDENEEGVAFYRNVFLKGVAERITT